MLNIHVYQVSGKWSVWKDCNNRATKILEGHAEAIILAHELAKKCFANNLYIHDKTGKVCEKIVYHESIFPEW